MNGGYLVCKNCGHLIRKDDEGVWIHIIGWYDCVPMMRDSKKAEPY